MLRIATSILLLFSFLGDSHQQLQVQVTRHRHSSTSEEVLEEYVYPAGFSLDWYVTSYINLPKEGVEGLLLYQPIECSPRSLTSPELPENCASRNFSLLLLVQNLLSCPGRVIRYAQENGYSGVISYSNGDQYLEIKNRVYDPSIKSVVDLGSTGLLMATVSEKFANTLLNEVAVSNCSSKDYKITAVSLGPLKVEAVRFGISIFITFSAILGLLGLLACLFLLLKCLRRRSGFYNVQVLQMQELGFSTPGEAHERTMYSLYRPKLKRFDVEEDTSNSTCPICLDTFTDSEDVSMLGCEGQHIFHPACISRWLSSQSTCPVCRNLLQTNT